MNLKYLKDSTSDLKIFICGPTIYERSHLGHARIFIFFSFIINYYLEKGYKPKAIVQLTDIDPKIYEKIRLKKNKDTCIRKLTDYYLVKLFDDLQLLGVLENFIFSRVSDFMELIKDDIVKILYNKYGYSYGGNVYIKPSGNNIDLIKDFLSMDIDNMPIDISEGKINQNDILLWNAENFYPVVGTKFLVTGIPGWHFQDGAIIKYLFKGLYDIHGGAKELIYPHHLFISKINQKLNLLIADESPATWLRIGHININSEKMSNSKKNTISISKFIKKYNSNTLKLFFFMHGYRDDIDIKKKEIEKAYEFDKMIDHFYLQLNQLDLLNNLTPPSYDEILFNKFMDILKNDFDTTSALKFIIQLISDKKDIGTIDKMVRMFGLRYY